MKALRERIEKLCASSSSRAEGLALQRYHDLVNATVVWRGGRSVANLPDDIFQRDLQMFVNEGVVLPAYLCQVLVNKAASEYAALLQWDKYLDTILPFGGSENSVGSFDYMNPQLKSLPKLKKWRMRASMTTLLTDTVAPMLYEGQASMNRLLGLSKCVLAKLEGEDEIMMERSESVLLQDLRTAFEAFTTIIELPMRSTHASAVESLLQPSSSEQSDPDAPLFRCRSELGVSAWYLGRAQQFMKWLPAIIEKEGVVSEHLESLAKYAAAGESQKSATWTKPLTNIVDDFSQLAEKVNGDFMRNTMAELCSVVIGHVGERLNALRGDPKFDEVDGLSSLLQSASIAWPLDASIPNFVQEVQVIRSNISEKTIVTQLLAAINGCCAPTAMPDMFLEMTDIVARAGGVQLPPEGANSVLIVAGKALHILLDNFDDQKYRDGIVRLLDELLRLVPKSAKCWHSAFFFVVSMISVYEGRACLQATPPVATDVANFRKSLADFKSLLQSNMWLKGLPEALETALNLRCSEVAMDSTTMNQQSIEATIKSTEADLTTAIESLLDIAYGGTEKGVKWNSPLKADSDMARIAQRAADSGLLDLDIDELQLRRVAVVRTLSAWTSAHGLAGTTPPPQTVERSDSLVSRAILTQVEKALIMLSNAPAADADDLRAKVQENIKILRACGMKEKDALMNGMFRWAYGVLTSRK